MNPKNKNVRTFQRALSLDQPAMLSGQSKEIQTMSRTELEVLVQVKTVESNSFKHHFNEMEKKCMVLQTRLDAMKNLESNCTALQTSLDEMKNMYAQTSKMYENLRRSCSRFISDVQSSVLDGATSNVCR